ncbi:MAG: adenosylcobinamide-GDP ribazoletransferase, partial [Acidimicrobiales bacterium]
ASRGAMAVALVAVPYVGGGLGTAFLGGPRLPVLAVAGVLPLTLAVLADAPAVAVAAVLAAGLAAAAVVALGRRRLGGVTGDVVGAAGVVAETVGLVVATSRW